MRLDKYLKLSKIIKRRTVAKEAALQTRVEVNGKSAKPSTTLNINDEITIRFGLKILKVKVTSLILEKDSLMYELIDEEKR